MNACSERCGYCGRCDSEPRPEPVDAPDADPVCVLCGGYCVGVCVCAVSALPAPDAFDEVRR